VLLGVSFFVLQRWVERGLLSDAPIYESYGQLVRAGDVPYRDFALAYPPASVPAFVLPTYLPWSYATSFAVVMGLCGVGCIAAAASVLRALGAGPRRSAVALVAIGLSPLALGGLFGTRFDLWPTLLAVGALAAVLHDRPRAFGVLAGLAFAAKVWPLVLVPVCLAYLWRRAGRRPALQAGAAFLATAAACVLPFVALAPGGVADSIAQQLDRPLQVESLGAAALVAAHHLGAPSPVTTTSYGSQNLAGSAADTVAAVSSALEVVAVVGIWILFARMRRPSGDALVLACAAAVAAMVATGKVFSPQYLIWLVPLAPLVRGRRGIVASVLLLAALGLTQTWFPGSYWSLALAQTEPFAGFLLLRDLAVLALATVLVWPAGLENHVLGKHRAGGEPFQPVRAQVERRLAVQDLLGDRAADRRRLHEAVT
jgi:uncharacterized membrane protein